MSDFPPLKTGAIAQYPASKSTEYGTHVLRFVDGAEQRFPGYASPLRRWIIRLDLLDEGEVDRLLGFFRLQGGGAGTFSFTDPWDGTTYSNCSFEGDTMTADFHDEGRFKTTLTVRANRS